ncbi:hypothetical protein TVAG_277750 [Trichomonas vaginalis G3]|uniref:Uncharacterized protein n=1 Tax=Trichomonas vaginalis (strain ATCC PRA-98 / G3) TaxID=412133 RepID=A2FF36_TRIV3|nr:hypothetical protein TVAGG3_0223210 [Trichomonas vaginalis G3]EAX96494.1 hypothetical protein TVAG_277750 [Trichomonas vaginalis G3]KAI5552103.1 hypothetical protein TVAGG3_0223210 [Trichomonas vaginalis G3]|eukprot:XP_001309424.1 hypothetical protein [Trichomonas vaginalis G3]
MNLSNAQLDGHDHPTSPLADQVFSPMSALTRGLTSPSKVFDFNIGVFNDFNDVRYNDASDPIFNDDLFLSPKKPVIDRNIPIPIINQTTTKRIIDRPAQKVQKARFVMKPFATFDSIELTVKSLNSISTIKV